MSLFFTLDLPSLQSIVLNGNNFATATTALVSNLPALTTFTTENDCFAKSSLHFSNDPKLQAIALGAKTAMDGSLALESCSAVTRL